MKYGLDLSTREGAEVLSRQIRDYWREHGAFVETTLVMERSDAEPPAHRLCTIRSDMVNGLPAKQGRNLREVR